jgi:hypothetical protein
MKTWEKALMFGMLWSIQGGTSETAGGKVVCALFCMFYVVAALVLVFRPNNSGEGRPK